MSSERLLEIDAVMQRHIDSGEIQGAVTMVARRGKVVHFKAHGLMDVERGRAMQEDAIFRMASSSKPVLGVAAMMMIEEGLLHPSDEVATYLPQFKDLHFFLPPAKESRRVVIHGLDTKAKGWDEPSRYVSASGGLASTARDFLRFEQISAEREREWFLLGSGHTEAEILGIAQSDGPGSRTARVIVALLRSCAVYQFHDTSKESRFKQRWDSSDNAQLRSHGGNLAAVLLRLEREDIRRFELICYHISRILPVFDRFEVEETNGTVLLRWKASSTDKTFGPHLTSDGSLRLFALVTLLNLPSDVLPDVLLLDEPELGLHPAAIGLIAGMIKQRSLDRQIIVATQSPRFVDSFDLDEIVVLELRDGRTECRRLEVHEHRRWIDEFTPGQLWEKNLLGGRP